MLSILIIIFPWKLKRWILQKVWGFNIHKSARIGLSYIYPKLLVMKENSKIGHFNVAINLDEMVLGHSSTIARSNWITGFPTNTSSKHFKHQENRTSRLVLGSNSAITKHHHLDCTNEIMIGKFVTVAGYRSQFLTHSIDIYESRQHSEPIVIGDYCFIGTNSVILGGSSLPANSVLGAKSLLNKKYYVEFKLYGGVPSKVIADIKKEAKYFNRKTGYIY